MYSVNNVFFGSLLIGFLETTLLTSSPETSKSLSVLGTPTLEKHSLDVVSFANRIHRERFGLFHSPLATHFMVK